MHLRRSAGFACACAAAVALLACGGGGGATGAQFDPGQATPTRLATPDGLISVLIPTDALAGTVQLSLANRTGDDAGVPGPEGRSLLLALEFTGMNPALPGADGAAGTPPTPATLAAAVEVSLRLPFTLRTDISLPVYMYNSASRRYEAAGLSATPSPADPLATSSDTVKFSITAFGRYAVFSPLPSELPPPAPLNLRLLAASTQVRQLAWAEAAPELVTGYNLYRADLSQAAISFTKRNASALLAATTFSDELETGGAYRYRVTCVNAAGIESDPGNEVDSPAVAFDVTFTFGKDVLDAPTALALDPAGGRLVVADGALRELHAFTPAGEHLQVLRHYSDGRRTDPRGLAFNADGSRLYVTDGTLQQCLVLDSAWKLIGRFGAPGHDPGEFSSPGAVLALADRVLVADTANNSLQAFTPLGVFLSTAAEPFAAPGALLLGQGGWIYACDSGNNRVQLLNSADLAMDKLLDYPAADGGPLLAPDGLAEDFRGRLYVADTGNHRVVVSDQSGAFLFHFGADGGLTVEFSAGTGPRGMALDRATGYLYVCDPGNHRIAVFKT